MPSHKASWSAIRREVILLVLPHRMKSASFNWFIKACLQESIVDDKNSLSFGGAARWRIKRIGVAEDVEGTGGDRMDVLMV